MTDLGKDHWRSDVTQYASGIMGYSYVWLWCLLLTNRFWVSNLLSIK